jgi:hypothetical protein
MQWCPGKSFSLIVLSSSVCSNWGWVRLHCERFACFWHSLLHDLLLLYIKHSYGAVWNFDSVIVGSTLQLDLYLHSFLYSLPFSIRVSAYCGKNKSLAVFVSYAEHFLLQFCGFVSVGNVFLLYCLCRSSGNVFTQVIVCLFVCLSTSRAWISICHGSQLVCNSWRIKTSVNLDTSQSYNDCCGIIFVHVCLKQMYCTAFVWHQLNALKPLLCIFLSL